MLTHSEYNNHFVFTLKEKNPNNSRRNKNREMNKQKWPFEFPYPLIQVVFLALFNGHILL